MPESNERHEPSEQRRRRKERADALGSLLPESASDESARAWGDRDDSSRDDDLLRDVPPHHG